jgi:hypothetical protein
LDRIEKRREEIIISTSPSPRETENIGCSKEKKYSALGSSISTL